MEVAAAERAYEDTRAAILDGRYAAGEMISEGEVADALGMSRTPVREAFLRLQAERFHRLFPKRGALVQPVTAAEAADVLEARLVLETWAAHRIGKFDDNGRRTLVSELARHLADQRRAVKRGDTRFVPGRRPGLPRGLVASSGNQVMEDLYSSLRDRQLRIGIASLGDDPGRTKAVLDQHAAILAAVEAADGAALRRLLAGHVVATRAALGLRP